MSTPIHGWQRRAVYVARQNSFTDMQPPGTSGAAHLIDFSVTPTHQREELQYKTGDRHPRPMIQRKRSAEWSLETYLEPSGSAGTAPALAPVLEAALGAEVDTSGAGGTVLADPAPDTTTLTLDGNTGQNLSSLTAGTLVRISLDGGAIIRAISDAADIGIDRQLTLTPALPQSPTGGEAVSGGFCYRPSLEPPFISIGADLEQLYEFAQGAVVGSATMSYSGSGDLRLQASGPARQGGYTRSGSVGTGGIDDSDTSLPVSGSVDAFSIGSYIQVEDEVMLVSAISDADLTVERGVAATVAAAHAEGLEINAYIPAPVLSGEPLAGSIGGGLSIMQGGALYAPVLTSVSVGINNNPTLVTDEVSAGDTATRNRYGRADYSLTLGMQLDAGLLPMLNQFSRDIHRAEVLTWIGDSPGRTVAFYAPQAEMQLGNLPADGDEEIRLDQQFRCLPASPLSWPLIIGFF